ncbi:menaquinone biosynthetic enzyme MqnA/MqnD family protein [Desulfovibrio litoralis]|uniref:Chorismate dehydratase n=1 Tax=Desulfovibrio litoralis DSM 11393 TaxID=1121455 RepID=A0A1M7TIX0_9BACT|nr:menaquinone biosynthesis protein [Desulfovibrio litoralis]SHN70636.1 chorismate dehydratase [Desulfovibrio litoralis DSM 11393]
MLNPNPNNKNAKLLGRIGYLNVLPIYHALESGAIKHGYQLYYGPPASLNTAMEQGRLVASSCSCIEYARRPEQYFLLPRLAIGSVGAVQSVLMLSQVPIEKLKNETILVSAETHTSAMLLRLLLKERYKLNPNYEVGNATERVATAAPPLAFLAIGDEAMRLRKHPLYPYQLDLGEAWTSWTGLPCVFGVWVMNRNFQPDSKLEHPAIILEKSRDWGIKNLDQILNIAEINYPNLSRNELIAYFKGLSYDLNEKEQEGLNLLYAKFAQAGFINQAPKLCFAQL